MNEVAAGPRDANRDKINPRWVMYTLRERGLPVPVESACREAIRSLSSEDSERLNAVVQRLARGSENDADSAYIRDWIERAKSERRDASQVASGAQESEGAPTVEFVPAVPGRQREFEPSHHVYGTKGALCIEPVEARVTREGQSDEVFCTLQIEAAKSYTGGRYDWAHKLVFRLTRRELPLFVGATMGFITGLEFGNHGPASDKSLSVREQPESGSLYVRLQQGSRLIGVPIGAEEIFDVASMGLKMLSKNAPHLDSQTLLHVIRRASSMYGAKNAGRE